MVLCQVYLTSSNPTLYDISVYGKKKVRIIKIDFRATNIVSGNPAYYTIRLVSSILRVPLGNMPSLMFNTNPAYQVGNIHGNIEFDCNFNGKLDFEIFDNDTGQRPIYFSEMILYLDITDAE
jgi:hypothetical protein